MNVQTIANTVSSILANEDDIKLGILFGSVAADKATRRSDVDIAVAGPGALSPDRRVELADVLRRALGREVDLVDLTAAHGPILREVLVKGQIVKKTDATLYAALLRRLWYQNADVKPMVDFILAERRKRFLHG